jgi:hypothetical protein
MPVAHRIQPASLLLLALLGCSGPSDPSTGSSLRVTILGLPTGAAAAVTVSGPGGFSQPLSTSQTLTQLAPGTYAITASDVSTAGAQYSPSPASQTVAVNSTQATATVRYAAAGGNLTINITGLGTSKTATVTVTGAAGYNHLVNSSTTLTGLTPGDYTVAAANPSTSCTNSVPTPGSQIVAVVARQTSVANVDYSPQPGSTTPNLCIAGMYLIQSAQNLSGDIPLVQNRGAYLRVFPVADLAGAPAPVIQLRFFLSGVPQGVPVFVSPTRGTAPTAADESDLNNSWNYLVDASLIQPGLSIEATVDPTNAIPESNDSDNVFTIAPLDIRPVPTLGVTLLPVLQTATGKQGNATDANKNAFLDITRSMHPINGVDVQVRSFPLTTSTTLLSDGTGWPEVLTQVNAAAVADGRYYYGVAKVGYTSGVAGIAYVSQPSIASHAALGWDTLPSAGIVMAHELAHNWGRKHAPCGGPSDVDVNYPDPTGLTDSYGLDLSGAQPTLKPATMSDIMGYCNTKWVSEYTYRGVFDYLAPAGLSISADQASQPVQPSLLVWGHLGNDGLVLEPAFHLSTRPVLPRRGGPYTIEGLAADGSRVFVHAFSMTEVADLPASYRSFAFAVPLSDAQSARLTSIRLTGDGRMAQVSAASAAAIPRLPSTGSEVQVRRGIGARVALRWDHRAYPMVMVRDPDTGDVLSFARGGEAEVMTSKTRVDLLLSDGVRSMPKRVRVVQ